jgi:hypothetical protein
MDQRPSTEGLIAQVEQRGKDREINYCIRAFAVKPPPRKIRTAGEFIDGHVNPLQKKVTTILLNPPDDIVPIINEFVEDVYTQRLPGFTILAHLGTGPQQMIEYDIAAYFPMMNIFLDGYSADCIYAGNAKIFFDVIRRLRLENTVFGNSPYDSHFELPMKNGHIVTGAHVFNELIAHILIKYGARERRAKGTVAKGYLTSLDIMRGKVQS